MDIYLETARLILRRFTPEDVHNLWELDSDPEVTRYLNGGQPIPYEEIRDEQIPRLLGDYRGDEGLGRWAVERKDSGMFIGRFFLKRDRFDPASLDMGYRLKPTAWGHGYATEVARALVRKAFADLHAPRVAAYTLPENRASWRVMEKAGLSLVRRFVWEAPGKWHHGRAALEYALSRQAWESGRSRESGESSGV
jgi:RimJ/RimL family protein N-acetyltransferase